jgi:hypothetical protein
MVDNNSICVCGHAYANHLGRHFCLKTRKRECERCKRNKKICETERKKTRKNCMQVEKNYCLEGDCFPKGCSAPQCDANCEMFN